MRPVVLATVLVVALAPTAAHAKGTNVRISSAPNGTDAGEEWQTLIKVTMPGNGPLAGVRPKVIIRRGVQRRTFEAERTPRKGVYLARVVFPSRGRWHYGVDDGFDRFEPGAGRVHDFPRVTIGPDEPELATPPLPISGDIEPAVAPGAGVPGAPPVARQPAPRKRDDSFPVLALLIPAFAAAGLALRFTRASRWLRFSRGGN